MTAATSKAHKAQLTRMKLKLGGEALLDSAVKLGANRVEIRAQNAGTKAPEDCNAIVQEMVVKLDRKSTFGLTKLIWTLLRPIVVHICFLGLLVVFASNGPAFELPYLPFTIMLALAVMSGVWGLFTDPIFLRSLGLNRSGIPPGVFYKPGSVMEKILQRCNYAADGYRPPPWLFNGDWTTASTALMEDRPVRFERIEIPLDDNSTVPVDICMEFSAASVRESAPLLVLLAGVGGDSDAKYVRHMCHAASEHGWMSVVIAPRGLGNHVVDDCKHIFNPCDLTPVHRAITFLASASPASPLFGVGFSMGGCMFCNYLARYQPPPQFKAAVAVCGAFKFTEFTLWHRYASVFQPLIVPTILRDLVGKYGRQLMQQLGLVGLKQLCTSDRYAQLSSRLFAKIHPVPSDYAAWQALQEPLPFRDKIKTPLLLFTATDDPLHHPGMIQAETKPKNPHIGYYVTRTGGHVAWPTGWWPKDFSFMTGVVTRFVRENLKGVDMVETVGSPKPQNIDIPKSLVQRNLKVLKRANSADGAELNKMAADGRSLERKDSITDDAIRSMLAGTTTGNTNSTATPGSSNNTAGTDGHDSKTTTSGPPPAARMRRRSSVQDGLHSGSDSPRASAGPPIATRGGKGGPGKGRRSSLDMPKPRPGHDAPPLAADFLLHRIHSRRSSVSDSSSGASSPEPRSPLSVRSLAAELARSEPASNAASFPRFRQFHARRKTRPGAKLWVQSALLGAAAVAAAALMLSAAMAPARNPLQHANGQAAQTSSATPRSWLRVSQQAWLSSTLLLAVVVWAAFATRRVTVREQELMTWLRDMEDTPRRAAWHAALAVHEEQHDKAHDGGPADK